jgi:hypothetical protein
MNESRGSMIPAVQTFALELLRSPSYNGGHAETWERVARACTFEELLLGLGHCAGSAECAHHLPVSLSIGSRDGLVAFRTVSLFGVNRI